MASQDTIGDFFDDMAEADDTSISWTLDEKSLASSKAPSAKKGAVQNTKFTFTAQLTEDKNWASLVELMQGLVDTKRITYIVCGHEKAPTTNKEHGQGYVELPPKSKTTVTGCKKLFGGYNPHVEVAVASPLINRDYCLGLSKGKTPNSEYFEHGKARTWTKDGPGVREKMDWAKQLQLARKDFTECDPRLQIQCLTNLMKINDMAGASEDIVLGHQNWWLYGRPGTGKTRTAHAMALALGCSKPYLKDSQTKWWCGYRHEDVVIIDEFEQTASFMGHLLKLAGDVRAFKAESKGSSKLIRPKHVIVTSNYKIEDIWTDEMLREAIGRRYRVLHVQNFEQALNEWQEAKHETQAPALQYTTPHVPGFVLPNETT